MSIGNPIVDISAETDKDNFITLYINFWCTLFVNESNMVFLIY